MAAEYHGVAKQPNEQTITDDQHKEVAPFDHQAFLAQVSTRAGVYDMCDADGNTLYIGKAKNLKNRLSSYFRTTGLTTKTMALVSKIASIHVTITNSETEALLLEQNLIKDRRPPYNILLKDDKSYLYIHLSDDTFPRIDSQRGRRNTKGRYFGPFPNGQAVRKSLDLMQKIFKLRNCTNSYFAHRSRPCLQHQINRCKAPCVGLVNAAEYQQDVEDAQQFLTGKSQLLLRRLINRMDSAVEQLDFETAAQLRDQISALRTVQEQQSITKGSGDMDVIGFAEHNGEVCFDVLMVRAGQVLGHKHYLPKFKLDVSAKEYLEAFMGRFYIQSTTGLQAGWNIPAEIIIPFELNFAEALEQAITSLTGKKITIKHTVRTERYSWLQLANENASQSLQSHVVGKSHIQSRFQQLSQLVQLNDMRRIECFDISHTMGEATIASCVAFDADGPLKSGYRRYNMRNIIAGDDYAAMRQALRKRYQPLAEALASDDAAAVEQGEWPDLILIDGGKGQLSSAMEIMTELQLTIPLLGVAKGVTRKAGLEKLFYHGQELNPAGYEGALLFIQHIRDESHRFAITGHRQKRQQSRQRSLLEDIPGIGSKRRAALLKFFGSRAGVYTASIEELCKVEGISLHLATQIHDYCTKA